MLNVFKVMIIFLFTFLVVLVLITLIVYLLGLLISWLNLPSYIFALITALYFAFKITKEYFEKEL